MSSCQLHDIAYTEEQLTLLCSRVGDGGAAVVVPGARDDCWPGEEAERVAEVVEEDPDGGGGGALGRREPGRGHGRRRREHHHAGHAVQDGAQVAHSGVEM